MKKIQENLSWPKESHFTIEDMQTAYPKMVNITLRFRIKKAEQNGEIVLIGKVNPPIGRPRKVYSVSNPSSTVLEKAKQAGVVLLVDSVTAGAVVVSSTETTVDQKVSV